jgi:D-alanyl-D-alanine carboxypeptidase
MELIALAEQDRQKPSGAPGTGYYYSDTNYILLGLIIEKVSSRPYKKYITNVFLEPLGMRSTYFYSDYLGASASPPPPKTVQGYLLATNDLRTTVGIHPMFHAVPGEKRANGELLNTTLAAERVDAAAGIVTTLRDLAKFASPLFRGKLLSPESQIILLAAGDEMEIKPVSTRRTRILQSIRKPYGVLRYKAGDGPGGVNTLMAYLPAKDRIYLGFANIFGYFNEVDFMMDEVIGAMIAEK